MPPWGRPPGGGGGVGRYNGEVEDVYRFQELDSDDDRNGVMVDPGHPQRAPNKNFNPDELYFNDMDLRAWERRGQDTDGMVYGDDYGYDQEDEGFYDDGSGGVTMSHAEYEELLFQRALDKIRLARATGEPDVQLSQQELDAYQNRLLRPRAPAARPQAKARPISAPLGGSTNNAIANIPSSTSASGSGSGRSKKSQQRTSLFAPRPKKEKPSGRKRAPSNVSEATTSPAAGFMISGPSGQPIFAPVSAYPPRASGRSTGSPSRPGSRSASMSSRQAPTPPRATPPREVPGSFPSGSPHRLYREATPPGRTRPASSSSRHSMQMQDESDYPAPTGRSRSSSVQQPVKLVPFPVTDYQHYTAEPYQYHNPTQPLPPHPSSSQPQYGRRVGSGSSDSSYMNMPRRVPVPVQRAGVPMQGVQGSYSDPAIHRKGSSLRDEVSDEDQGGIMVEVVPEADERGYNVSTSKSSERGSGSGSGRDSERRRRSGRSRRKP